MAAALERLRAAGVADPEALVARLGATWPDGEVPGAVLDALADAADPALAVAGVGRLREGAPEALAAAAADADAAAALVALLGASNSVVRWLLAEPAAWPAVLAAVPLPPLAALVPRPVPPEEPSPEVLAQLLRVFKRRRVLLIAARDLLRRSTLVETMAELSRLAEDALEVAVAAVRARLAAAHGDVLDAGDRPLGFCVLGMGKLGGGELNFSSDIDLVYVYADGGRESAGGPRGALSVREFMSRLAEGVTKALHQATADGFVFRVDLRLRPEGSNGPIVNSMANALLYYESWGQTWERAAYLKARPVAGDRTLGAALLRELEPFVFRRYLDFATLEDLKRMKAKVAQALASGPDKGINVKLGRGGIREVEFVIQNLQLIHAGKDERIRERNSLLALERLVEARYLPADESARLAEAYRFLRDVEHKIQLVDERQTQVIPSGQAELQLARRLGYRGAADVALASFRGDRVRHMEAVAASFAALFYGAEASRTEDADGRYAGLLAGLDEDPAKTESDLAALGFADPRSARAQLVLLRDGAPTSRANPRRKQLLLAVAPALLGEVARAPDPDLALRHLAGFMAAIGARSSFLSLLAENRATLRVLVRLFGSSEFLSQTLIRHPEMLDNLVRADLVRLDVPKAALAAEAAAIVQSTDGYESRLDALRRFHHEQFLRIGINDLDNLLPFHVASSQLSDLADVCLDAAWHVAEDETCRRYGISASPGRFAVVGLGKLGARELTYNSDLDLIFVYVPSASTAGPVSAHEFFTKLAQTLMTTLQVRTREGRMYSIDTRLRPSGNQGPLVSSLESFARYHAESAQLWERQAMIKARGVVGEPALLGEVEAIIARFVYARPLDDGEVAEIHRLRMRLEHELAGDERAELNIKTGRGGLLDIEFMVQMKQLRYGSEVPAVRQRATRHALAALAAAGVVPADEAASLEESYAFLRALTNRLRIERDQSVESIERESERLPALARRLGYAGTNEAAARQLLADYGRHRERVRALYVRWFGV
ncbi:MAG: bifunctional glutamine synthetase adenylyltransferase/deadenyltransferase [Polyangiaceae bacterium UTPRO1]|jgi:glutamate-ammonia-ligase adenylyltransferase|nr:bifunctional [glutamate--ammonia ligase]-adenylyl-L-tyrosine phosphorylase/[glutamate--ammonia-ligase] adenylyltransferase [Myxococcales bacterium]OQY66472.1 MAG: bifunctional glutamine synthetase adenylyltransferase/deadenyltransferase [Polyangiaceae bacterium UTPRO1]